MNKKIIALTVSSILCTSGFTSLGIVAASATPVQTEFTVTSLSFENLISTDTGSCTGDDGGLVSIAGSNLLVGGDYGTCAYSLVDMSGNNPAGALEDEGSFIFTDLSTSSTYFFDRIDQGSDYIISKFTPVNNDFTLGIEVALSEDIVYGHGCVVIGNGWGRVVLWDLCTGQLHDINISDGTVSTTDRVATYDDFTGATDPLNPNDWSEADTHMASGIAEYSNGVISFVYSDDESNGIYRFYPSDVTSIDLILDIDGSTVLGELYSFTASFDSGQWCGHSENSLGAGEAAFCADAVFSVTESTSSSSVPPVIANGYRADNLGSVYFAPGSSKLSKVAKNKIKALVTANPAAIYKVSGYVQKSLSAKNNAKLSLARAKAVETYLVSLGAGVTFSVVVDAGGTPAKSAKSDKARRATLFAMTPVVQ